MTNLKLRLLILLNHIFVLYAFIYYFSWSWLAAAYAIFFIGGCIGISAGYHRYWCHRSFDTSKFMQYIMLICGTWFNLGSAITWVGKHREHHHHSDEEGDPHSPKWIGRLRTFFHVWKNLEVKSRYVKDLMREPYLKFQHRYYFQLQISIIILLYLAGGFAAVGFLYALPSIGTFYSTGLINSLGHWNGEPQNTPWWHNLFTGGESYHRNHHDRPQSDRFGSFDPTYFIIKAIKT
tara:strand:+ start:1346 stop:2050 length:705 start_codon:yes stop_codon:yes gene_type:complete